MIYSWVTVKTAPFHSDKWLLGPDWMVPKVRTLDSTQSHCQTVCKKQFKLTKTAISSLPCPKLPLYLEENEARQKLRCRFEQTRQETQRAGAMQRLQSHETLLAPAYSKTRPGVLTLSRLCKAHGSMVACEIYSGYNWKKLRHSRLAAQAEWSLWELRSVAVKMIDV